MKEFVLLRKGQVAVTGESVAGLVAADGFKAAAQTLGVGDSTLRKFLNDEGFRFVRHTSWQVEHLGLEGQDGATGDVPTPEASPAEPAGT